MYELYPCQLHPKPRYNKLCNVTHSLVFQDPREQKFLVQISPLIVSLKSLVLPLSQTTIEVNPHPCKAPCVNMWECLIVILMPLVELLVHEYVTLL